MDKNKRTLVVFPGRGSYNDKQLGYFTKNNYNNSSWLKKFDDYRLKKNKESLTELDSSEKFDFKKFYNGQNAASLIASCSLCDFEKKIKNQFNVVAITGNSMGWYTSLAASEVLESDDAIDLIDTMGSLSNELDGDFGKQVIYSFGNESWERNQNTYKAYQQVLKELLKVDGVLISEAIDYGEMVVIGCNDLGATLLLNNLEKVNNRFPFVLPGNHAFHTQMLKPVSIFAKNKFKKLSWKDPKVSIISGNGKIWDQFNFNSQNIFDYTLGEQVFEKYNFTKAIQVAVKDFGIEQILAVGPGNSLALAIGQTLVGMKLNKFSKKSIIDSGFIYSLDPA